MTTEIAFLITYCLGAFVLLGFSKIAIILTITLTFILSIKESLNKLKSKITREEISNTLKFAVVSFVILPLLPDHKYAISDLFINLGATIKFTSPIITTHFLNPYGVWFFVVVISAVGYIGYVLSKVIGEKNSIIASGAIGGLISSTAVTASMTEKSKHDVGNISLYAV